MSCDTLIFQNKSILEMLPVHDDPSDRVINSFIYCVLMVDADWAKPMPTPPLVLGAVNLKIINIRLISDKRSNI